MPERTNVAFVNARPGMSEQLGVELLKLVGPTRSGPGCERYEIHRSAQDAQAWMILESWCRTADFESHMRTPTSPHFWRKSPTCAPEPSTSMVTRSGRQPLPGAKSNSFNCSTRPRRTPRRPQTAQGDAAAAVYVITHSPHQWPTQQRPRHQRIHTPDNTVPTDDFRGTNPSK